MPKIINHDVYREELVGKVATLFAEQGYGSLGMRQIAKELTISKSALYHYFPTKEALFAAVCDQVVQVDLDSLSQFLECRDENESKLSLLFQYCHENESWFVRQFLLLTDFLRDKSVQDIREYQVLQKAHQRYLDFIQRLLGLEDEIEARGVFVFINGLILTRFLDGQTTTYVRMADWLIDQVQNDLTISQHIYEEDA